MNLCSDKHDEVCYEGRTCPVCDMRSDKESEVEDAKRELKEEQEINESLQTKIDELKAEVERLCSGALDGER